MRKDINFHTAEKVQVVAIREWDKDFLAQHWNIYVVNNSDVLLETVLVMSRGISEDKKTTTLRRNLGNLSPESSIKIEFITDTVLGFTNEYLVTYFSEDKLYEKVFTFLPHSISEKNTTEIPVIHSEGIIAS
ncbi:hypothetical protein ACFQO1_00010 [Jejudonia soesokkakensis]|uniref:Phenylalanyl-tRNA synthetase subunit alpha n=1 Tax=Jejudonia soesokkakensis TaxID=1323432 RepID=A0ABW2MQV2_9FLAO